MLRSAVPPAELALCSGASCEQIGALMEWAEALADVLESGIRRARSVQDATLNDLTSMRMEGSLGSVPRYGRYGSPNYKPGGGLTDEAASGLMERIGRAVGVDT